MSLWWVSSCSAAGVTIVIVFRFPCRCLCHSRVLEQVLFVVIVVVAINSIVILIAVDTVIVF